MTFVSFKTAKLINQLNLTIPTFAYYDEAGEFHFEEVDKDCQTAEDLFTIYSWGVYYPANTQEQVLTWLRKQGYHIHTFPNSCLWGYGIYKGEYSFVRSYETPLCGSHEDALNEAILYILKHIRDNE